MIYTHDRLLRGALINDAQIRVYASLSEAGVGVVTEIDIKAPIKKKIGSELDGYRILGACNPKIAYEAVGLEPRMGAMLPCNVTLPEIEGGTEVSAINPVASMAGFDNGRLHTVTGQVREIQVRAVNAA